MQPQVEEEVAMSTAERRARDFRQREQALLAAAEALLDGDWQAVTVDAIAERAEYAKGTVYRHFASKDEVYARLAIRWADHMQAELRALDAARPFEAVLRDFVAVAWRHTGDGVRARLGHFVRDPDFHARLPAAVRDALTDAEFRTLELIAGLIDLGVATGALPDAPLAPRVFAVQAQLAGAARLYPVWEDAAGVPRPDHVTAEAVFAILRARTVTN
jgi:AcrR family transcriptional regulator